MIQVSFEIYDRYLLFQMINLLYLLLYYTY